MNPLAEDLSDVLSQTQPLWEELRNTRIFITGGTGFFGCWLLETFAWANEHLSLNARAVVLTREAEKFRRKAPHLADLRAVHLHEGDVRDFDFPSGDFTHAIHAAAESSTTLNSTHPHLMLDTIVRGTQRCLDFAKAKGVKKFLFVSSGAVYGAQPAGLSHIPETYSAGPETPAPESAYAEGKRMAELQCALAANSGAPGTKIARCFAFVGPYLPLDAHFAIGNFIRDQMKGGPIVVRGDGTAVRSYLYAADLMIWLWTILFRGENGRAYNVGSEEAVSIRDLARITAEALEPRVAVEIRGAPTGAPPHRYVPCTARAASELGLRRRVDLPAAIQRTQRWFSR